MNSSFQSVSSLTESVGGANGEERAEAVPAVAPVSEGGLDDFGDFGVRAGGAEQAALDDAAANPCRT